ncbi:plasmid replication initiator TrfA [Rubrobacter indicoceani]|uniref:plasmid replication initiator TrfA n=1 Tax=Rubrobacter indicoceani TaxID=2051957 RepID=UPI000E5AD075|nr:plasmid replication initiator TrfA [Rubrobacter indicoceani]
MQGESGEGKAAGALSARETRHIVKAEGNFEDLPYFTVGNSRKSGGVLEYKNEIRSGDGQVLQQSWTVRAMSGYGLPGGLDQDVYVALLQIIDRDGELPEDRWIGFSLYEMVELLNRSHGGRDYQQVKQSLDRLAGTRIQSKNAFYHRDSKTFMDGTFGLLDRVQHAETVDGYGRRTDKTHVQLSEYFVTSYRSDYLKGLDTNFYYSLSSPVAKRLYRFIDKKRNHRRQWQTGLFSLRDRIPLSNYKYASKVKEKLGPAHQELVDKGFLESFSYSRTPDREYLVTYVIRDAFSRRRPEIRLERTPENLIAIERLKAEGVWSETSEELVASYGSERCMHFCLLLQHQKNLKNRPAWLRWAIVENPDLDLPTGLFVPDEASKKLHNTTEPAGPPPEDPQASEVWGRVLESFSSGSSSTLSTSWFDDAVPVLLDSSGSLYVSVPNELARDYVAERFGETLSLLLTSESGQGSVVTFLTYSDSFSELL